MPKNRVPTTEEIKARAALRAKGLDPDSPVVAMEQRNRADAIEDKLARELEKPLTQSDVRKTLDQILSKYGVEPAEELIKLATEKTEDGKFVLGVSDRVEIWGTLMQYRNAKLRATEHSGSVDSNITVNVIHFGTGEVMEKKVQVIDVSGLSQRGS